MNDNSNKTQIVAAQPSFMNRVLSNETARKGLAGAIAGVLVAVVSEVIWPSES